jgi:hypothetical protein
MKVKVTPVNRYEITINGKTYHDFQKREEWEGMVKFSGPAGVLILSQSRTDFEGSIEALFGIKTEHDRPVEMDIIKASPDLVSQAAAPCAEKAADDSQ